MSVDKVSTESDFLHLQVEKLESDREVIRGSHRWWWLCKLDARALIFSLSPTRTAFLGKDALGRR